MHCDYQEVRKGFTWGSVTIAPLMEDEEDGDSAGSSTPVAYGPDDRLVIPFQNENLYACLEKPDGSSKVRRPRRTSMTQANVTPPADTCNGPGSDHCARLAKWSSTWDA